MTSRDRGEPSQAEPTAFVTPERPFAQSLFDGAAYEYDRVAAWLSYGQYRRWHRFVATRIGADGLVLDVATGTGAIALDVARRGPCTVVGVDQSAGMLASASDRVARAGLGGRIRLLRAQAEALPFADATFDAVVFSYLLRYVAAPPRVVEELTRVLKPGGTLVSLEFDLPRGAWRLLWNAHTRLVLPAVGRWISPGWAAVGRFLGGSIERYVQTNPTPAVLRWWRDAGIPAPRARRLSLGGAVVIWGEKK